MSTCYYPEKIQKSRAADRPRPAVKRLPAKPHWRVPLRVYTPVRYKVIIIVIITHFRMLNRGKDVNKIHFSGHFTAVPQAPSSTYTAKHVSLYFQCSWELLKNPRDS